MELITTAEATALVSTIVSYITENIGAILLVVGAVVGLRFAARLLNGGTKGKVRV